MSSSPQRVAAAAIVAILPPVPSWLTHAEEPDCVIYPNELENGQKVLTTFTDEDSDIHRRWVVLLAFPQSGKTTTFLFVACEMLRLGKVCNVIIMCGNADIDLKNQLVEAKENFIQKAYDIYLEETIQYDSRTRRIFLQLAKSKISILFGAGLDSGACQVQNTLIIWDEAHYAQDRTNRPHKYLQGVNITADGNVSNLEGGRNNYVLTVSATPFSELSNVVHNNQSKRIVKMRPGVSYLGPRQFIERGSVIQFDHTDRMNALKNAMLDSQNRHQGVPKYCVVRFIGDENVEECRLVAADVGWWDVRVFDSKSTSMRSMNDLSVAPVRNTLVVIRGKCRMGKKVPKMHISFVFESSIRSSTDVLLQALFARMFGYDANVDIKIYISDKIQMSEIWRYVEMMEDTDDAQPVKILPIHAKNLTTTKIHAWDDTIPIILRTDDDAAHEDFFGNGNRTAIIQKVKSAFNQMMYEEDEMVDDSIENYNSDEQTAEIARQISNAPVDRNADAFSVVIHKMENLAGQANATYAEMPERMRSSIENRVPLNSGNLAGCGFASDNPDVVQINLWVFNTPQFHQSHGFKLGDIVIHARVPHVRELHELVSVTTRLETFATHEEDGSEVRSNGSYSIQMPVATVYDVDAMKSYLTDVVRLSRSPDVEVRMPNYVTSNHDGVSKWVGITLSSQVLQALQKGGDVYNHIKREFKLKLKIHKVRGREPIDFVNRGISRIIKIEWI